MDMFLLPFIFSIWAAISFLLLLQVLFSVRTIKYMVIQSICFFFGIIHELIQWTRFLSWIAISSWIGCFWGNLIQIFFIIPITIYTFFQGVYDFGPKHRKWSLLGILWNPVPGIEYEGQLGKSADFDSLWRQRFNHNLIARQISRNKKLTLKLSTRSNTSILHHCPITHLSSAAPRLHGYETYATFNKETMGKQVNESEHSMSMTLYFAICHFSCPDIVFSD